MRLTFSDILQRIRSHPYWVVGGLVITGLGLYFDRIELVDLLGPAVNWAINLPTNIAWNWLFIVLGLYLLGWGGRRDRKLKEKQASENLEETKQLLRDATFLPNLIATRELQRQVLSDAQRILETANQHLKQFDQTLKKAEKENKAVPGFDSAEARQPYLEQAEDLCFRLDAVRDHLTIDRKDPLPKFSPPTPILKSDGQGRDTFVPSENQRYMLSAKAFLSTAEDYVKPFRRKLQNDARCLERLNAAIQQEIERLTREPNNGGR